MFQRLIAAGARLLRRLLPPDRPEGIPPAYEDPSKAIILCLIVAWIVLALLFAVTLYVRAEAGGCISHVEPGVEPVTICQVLWLPILATGGGQ